MSRSHPSRFVWHDLLTADPDAAAAFYTAVFGWTWSAAGDSSFQVAARDGSAVAGLGPIGEGAAAHWLSHLAVDDLSATCRRLEFLQGQVLVEPEEQGDTAILADTTGAVFAAFQAERDAAPEPRVGHIGWHELLAPRPDLGTRVYKTLLDWKPKGPEPTETGALYRMRARRADVGSLRAWPCDDDTPPQWVPFVVVEDVDAVVAAVPEAGGEVVEARHGLPAGDGALLRDPAGALFGVFMLR